MANRIFERRRWTALICPETGKAVVMDMFAERLTLMRRRIVAWAEITDAYRKELQEQGIETRMVMVLLTYRRVMDYRAGHINLYMKALKQSLADGLLSFAWVCELQARGAVHYHLVLVVKKGTRIPLPDKSGMWSHGLSGIHTARTPYYLVKYVGKAYQKDLARYPKSCRLYAASVRGLTSEWQGLFRLRSGLIKPESSPADQSRPAWFFAGCSVTEGYAREVLIPAGLEVAK
jgi:hypothetical protein